MNVSTNVIRNIDFEIRFEGGWFLIAVILAGFTFQRGGRVGIER